MKPLLLGLCVCALCFAQGDDDATKRVRDSRTDGHPNGRFWNMFSEEVRFGFVIGYCEGATDTLACPSEAQYGEIEKAIDRFYQDPENLRLPIPVAVQVFARRQAGMSEATIQAFLENARKFAVEHPTK